MVESGAKISCLAVIPARYAAQRLPAKPLADINGKSLIQRVYERTTLCATINKSIVATDDERILQHCAELSIPCCMTSIEHTSGSDRVAEVLSVEEKNGSYYDFVANVQGDMPFLNPAVLDTVISELQQASYKPAVGTVAVPITDEEEFNRASDVKVVFSNSGRALYFSRAAIPYSAASIDRALFGYKHIGLYVYTPDSIRQFTNLSPSRLEQDEKLEQLRALENDMPIHVSSFERSLLTPAIEVDTPEDLEAAREAAIDFDRS